MINIKSASGRVRVNHKPADVNHDSKHWSLFVGYHLAAARVNNVPVRYIRRRMEHITIPELTSNQLGG